MPEMMMSYYRKAPRCVGGRGNSAANQGLMFRYKENTPLKQIEENKGGCSRKKSAKEYLVIIYNILIYDNKKRNIS